MLIVIVLFVSVKMPTAVDSDSGFFRATHRKLAESLSPEQLKEFSALASDQERFQWLWDVRSAHEVSEEIIEGKRVATVT